MFGILAKNLNRFSRIHNQDLIGIDLSVNDLKIVHVRSSFNKKELANILTYGINGLSDRDISKLIKDSFNRLNVKKPTVIGVLSSRMVITKNIEIPSTEPGEIREIMNLQASRYTPYSREEIVVDYVDIDVYKHSYTKILLVIVPCSIVKRQFEILEGAGIRLENVVLAPEALASFLPKRLGVDTEAAPLSIINMDKDFSDFAIVFKNNPLFIRNIPIGLHHLAAERDVYQSKFIDELVKSLDGYQNEDIEKGPAGIVLTGPVQEFKNLDAILNEALHLPVTVIPNFQNRVPFDQSLSSFSSGHLSFANAISSLFVLEETKINLIPAEIRLKRAIEEKGRDLIKTGIFILAIFVLVFSALISRLYFKNLYLDALNNKYLSLNEKTQRLENEFLKVSLIGKYLSARGYSLEVLTELYKVMPLDLQLNDIRFDNARSRFSIKGTAESMSTVFSFVDSMEKSKYFSDVKTKYTTKRKDGLRDVTDFEIDSLLDKEAGL